MKISSIQEFRDHAGGPLESREPVLITCRGRVAGIFFPSPAGQLPVDMKRELFQELSAEVSRQLSQNGVTEEDLMDDFKSWRQSRRETGR
jgi:hypothetical protein